MSPICRLFGLFQFDDIRKTAFVQNDRRRPFIYTDPNDAKTLKEMSVEALGISLYSLHKHNILGWIISLYQQDQTNLPEEISTLCFNEAQHTLRQKYSRKDSVNCVSIEQGNYGVSNIVLIKTDSVIAYRYQQWVERHFFDGDRITINVAKDLEPRHVTK